jgi:hypothetical protein
VIETKKKTKKKPLTEKGNEVNSSDTDGSQEMVIKRKKKSKEISTEASEEFGINTQELKQRLAELESSDESDNEASQKSPQKSSRNALESSDEDSNDIIAPKAKHRMSEKRERSHSPDENAMNSSNNQMKKIRRIIDSDDE